LPPPFEPLFSNAHISTIAGNFWKREIDLERFPAVEHVIQTSPSSAVKAFEHQPEQPPSAHLVFVHGLEGSADAGYIRSMSQSALERGFAVHRTNLRSCGGTEHLSETMYHSGLTEDTHVILQSIRKRFDGPLIVIGFSLGGNVTLKLASEVGEDNLLTAACAVSTPLDLAECVQYIQRPQNTIYARRFLARLKDRVLRKALSAPHLYSTEALTDVRSIWAFDDRYTGPLFGFGNAETYYRTQSSQNFLAAIRIPTLVIQAKDDPLIPFSIYERQAAFRDNPALELLTTDYGGHLGFLSRHKPRFWLDQAVLDWVNRIVERSAAHSSTSNGTNRSPVASVIEGKR
jgi:predicted alpha/beta-fold hydrolase